MAEDIEYLKFDKGPWLEQDDVSYHHMRMLWVFPLVWFVFFPTLKSKLDRGGSPSGEVCHTNVSQLQFVIVITDEYTKHLKWIMQTSEHADWFWLPFVCCAFLNSTCRFPQHFAVSWIFFCPIFFLLLFYSVEDKQRVSTLTHIPVFLPEISIGAHDYDEKFYAYKSVRKEEMLILTVPGAYCCMSPPLHPATSICLWHWSNII